MLLDIFCKIDFLEIEYRLDITMTAITMPKTSPLVDEKGFEEDRPKKCRFLWSLAAIVSMVSLLLVSGFICYMTFIEIAPPCDGSTEPSTQLRTADLDFKAHGKFADNDFHEDYHYDQAQNLLVNKLTGNGPGENATIVHDYSRGLTAYVVPQHKKCFVGALELESYDGLSNAQVADMLETQRRPSHSYTSVGIIAPAYLERTASQAVSRYCSGMQTGWIEPVAAGGTQQQVHSLHRRANRGRTIVIKDGTVVSVEE